MPIDNVTRRDLRRLAHHLDPVVTVAEKGLTENVLGEIERALSDHELIKVKLAIADRDVRAGVRAAICGHTGADPVADIGKIAVLFKANPRAKPHLSNLMRPIGTKVLAVADSGTSGTPPARPVTPARPTPAARPTPPARPTPAARPVARPTPRPSARPTSAAAGSAGSAGSQLGSREGSREGSARPRSGASGNAQRAPKTGGRSGGRQGTRRPR